MQVKSDGNRYFLYKEQENIGQARLEEHHLTELTVEEKWRGKGYGSYFLKEILRANGGYDRAQPSAFSAPLPQAGNAAAWAMAKRFGFVPQAGKLWRRRTPDLTAVQLCHEFLSLRLKPGGLFVDATCGNGNDTLFLCRQAGENGTVLGMDIQPEAVRHTNALLAQNGFAGVGKAVLHSHNELLTLVQPGTADCVLFNFGWLPGADHTVHSTAENSIPALQAGLDALAPGGVLAAVLYSGKVIGNAEKKAALAFFRALPLAQYTVLICEFANWAETAPLPCFVLKREGQ